MPKNKPNKGLLKRIRVTASGRVKHGRAFGRHKRSHKSGKLLRSYHNSAYAHASDVRRVASMLHRRITAGGASRGCCTCECSAPQVEVPAAVVEEAVEAVEAAAVESDETQTED
ncbi:MAG: 50S ribosomal protein L35 [Phycisphaerales bacterium]|nr:50S ribosomal protein L35 [Phycisphaerales bacterium]